MPRKYDGTDPELPDGWLHDDDTPCPEYLAPVNGTRFWCTEHQQYLKRGPIVLRVSDYPEELPGDWDSGEWRPIPATLPPAEAYDTGSVPGQPGAMRHLRR